MTRKIMFAVLFLAPLGFYPFLCNTGPSYPVDDPDETCCTTPSPHNWSPDERRIGNAVACLLASPGQSYPANLAWGSLAEVYNEKSAELVHKLKHDPVGFLEDCLQHYEEHVQGYRLIFVKHEKVAGKMRNHEKIRVHFREQPFSVHMHWLKGQSECIRSMYVDGENDGKLVARGVKFGFEVPFLVTRALDAPDVKTSSRFPITEFGIYKGAKSTIDAMRAAEKREKLFVTYHGVECVKELGDRHCYKLVRGPYDPPEVDGINELTVYIDAQTLMQTGSILKDAKGDLIAEYFFRDIELNPTFDPKQFTEKGL
jgi:hypothetical protein